MVNATCSALTATEIATLRRAIGSEPAARAARRLHLDRHTMLRALAGSCGLRAGSLALIRMVLALNPGEPTP